MKLLRFIIETFNEILGNTAWYECRYCKTKFSQRLSHNRFINKKMSLLAFYYFVATFVFYLIFDYVNRSVFEYIIYFIAFTTLFLSIKIIFIKAERLEIENKKEKIKCLNCDKEYFRPIVKNVLNKLF